MGTSQLPLQRAFESFCLCYFKQGCVDNLDSWSISVESWAHHP